MPIGALIVDFVLIITISIAAGVSALIAYLPALAPYRIPIGLGLLAVVAGLTWFGHAGRLTFAVMTLLFIAGAVAVLVQGFTHPVIHHGQAPVTGAEGNLVVLDAETAAAYAARNGLPDASAAALAADAGVAAQIKAGIAEGNTRLSRPEQVKRFQVLPAFWEPGGDELTLTMKLRRKPIAQKYAAQIEALYAESPGAGVLQPETIPALALTSLTSAAV